MKTILVPVDFSDATPAVVEAAQKMAQLTRSAIVLLNIAEPEPDFVGFEPGPVVVRAAVANDHRAEHQKLNDLKATVSAGGSEVRALHIQGPIIEKILDQAREQGADLIVLGSHGHGAVYELLVGSVTSGVLRGATCPVLVVPVRK